MAIDWICCDACKSWLHFSCDLRKDLHAFKDYSGGGEEGGGEVCVQGERLRRQLDTSNMCVVCVSRVPDRACPCRAYVHVARLSCSRCCCCPALGPGSPPRYTCPWPRLTTPLHLPLAQAHHPATLGPGSPPHYTCPWPRLTTPLHLPLAQAHHPATPALDPGSPPRYTCPWPRLTTPLHLPLTQAHHPATPALDPGSPPRYTCPDCAEAKRQKTSATA